MESKLVLLCGLMLIFCVTAISAELVAYPHVGCFTGRNIRRYFNRKLRRTSSVNQQTEGHVMRCFEAARDGHYDIFAVTKDGRNCSECLTGRDAKKNLKQYQKGSDCQNGLGSQNSFDIYLVPGGETNSCQDLPDGEYQDSLFCNRFYTCMDGRATVKLCPMGLLFDPATRQCLDKVPCPRGKPCILYDDGEYPHPRSCRRYLVCYKHQAFEALCPSYLWFNDDTKQCDSPSNTECSNDPCEDSPCLNEGTCVASQEEDSQFKCTCKAGFTGTRCEVKVKPCSLHPCQNGGTCEELGDKYACKCKLGYGGQNCTEKTDFEDSKILSHKERLLKILLEYLKDVDTNGKHWKRCFNAKDHSYSASSFHSLCNNKGPTVTLVDVGRYVFGGYTDQAWTSSEGYKSSTHSFLFSLRSSTNIPFKSPLIKNYNYATYDSSTYGPAFGYAANDLHLSNNCRTTADSRSNLGGTYQVPSGYTSSTALAGSSNFVCDNYEVFYLA